MRAAAALALALALAMAMAGAAAAATLGTGATASASEALPFRMTQLKSQGSETSKVVPVLRASRPGVGARIVDGQEAEPCQFPHQAAMLTDRGEFCGGSLISARWVLTAAHCITSAMTITVYLGSHEWRTAPHQIKVSRIFLHGAYNTLNLNHDIALLDLGQDVPTSECVRPVELERSGCGDASLDGITGDVSGWGLTGNTSYAVQSTLRWVKTRIITNAACEEVYNSTNVVIQSTLCSMPVDEASYGTLCNGDSGGPLLHAATGRQIGINSFVSIDGCEVRRPSGYARVPCFADWIDYVTSL